MCNDVFSLNTRGEFYTQCNSIQSKKWCFRQICQTGVSRPSAIIPCGVWASWTCPMWARSGPQQLYCLGEPQGEVTPCYKKLKLQFRMHVFFRSCKVLVAPCPTQGWCMVAYRLYKRANDITFSNGLRHSEHSCMYTSLSALLVGGDRYTPTHSAHSCVSGL